MIASTHKEAPSRTGCLSAETRSPVEFGQVSGDPVEAASFLDPIADHIPSHGLGTASEIFDGDAPFTPRGCVAQAWTEGELLRAWTAIAYAIDTASSTATDKLAKKVVGPIKEATARSAGGIRMQGYHDASD